MDQRSQNLLIFYIYKYKILMTLELENSDFKKLQKDPKYSCT
jgi:hypothetical protein